MIEKLINVQGYVPPTIDPTHWMFGASQAPKDILQADGDWSAYVPVFESQAINFETDGCTVFGSYNAIEIILKKIFGKEFNYAERFTYNLAGIVPPTGTDPHFVAELIRKYGLISQESLPMTLTLSEFESPRPMTPSYLAQGQQWLTEHTFFHEWVWTNNPSKEIRFALLKEALMYSPVCMSVTAWYPTVDGMYPDNGQPNCHWVVCFKLEGDSPIIFDSYDQSIKKLSPDHHIEVCKRYYIGLAQTATMVQKDNWFIGILKAIAQSLGFISAEIKTLPTPMPQIISQPVETPEPKYLWETPEQARHSFRVICDEEGLSVADKNLLCQVLHCESGFKVKTVHVNNDKIKSVDNGICQFNSFWYKEMISPNDALNNPEKACRLFISQFKKGQLKDWVCYKEKIYTNYTP